MCTQLLTTNWSGILEHWEDLRIHLDVEVLLLSHFLCSLFHFLVNPVSKLITCNSIDHVCNVLSMEIFNLSLFLWEHAVHIFVWYCKLKHSLNRQRWKHWNVNEFDIFALDVHSISAYNIFKMIDGHRFICVQVDSAFRC